MHIIFYTAFALIYFSFITVLIHELSHCIAAKICGFVVTKFTVWPRINGKDLICGTVSFWFPPLESKNKLIFTYVAPVITSILIILLCFFLYDFLDLILLFIVQSVEIYEILSFVISMIWYESFEGYDGSKVVYLIKPEK